MSVFLEFSMTPLDKGKSERRSNPLRLGGRGVFSLWQGLACPQMS